MEQVNPPLLSNREQNPQAFREFLSRVVPDCLSKGKLSEMTGVGGATLATYHLLVPEGRRHEGSSTIVIVPGRTESFLKYAELIFDFHQAGHEVFSLDHRGQGLSERLLANPQVGYVRDFADYQADLHTFLASVVEPSHSFESCFVLAHSMGAALTMGMILDAQNEPGSLQSHFFEKKLTGLILSAPMLAIRLSTPQRLTEAVVGLRCLSGRGLNYATEPGPIDLETYGGDLTHSALRLAWYRELLSSRPEIRLGMPSNHWMKEALRYTRELRQRLKAFPLHLPVLLFTPGHDEVVDVEIQELITGPYDGDLLERVHLPHAAHDPFLETDAIRHVVFDRILDFVSSVP